MPTSEDGTQASQKQPAKGREAQECRQQQVCEWHARSCLRQVAAALAATSTTPDILCGHYKVDHIGLLTEAQFNDAVQVMESQLAAKAKRQSDERASREQRNRKNEFAGADLGDTNF
jgi:hypothetical protein